MSNMRRCSSVICKRVVWIVGWPPSRVRQIASQPGISADLGLVVRCFPSSGNQSDHNWEFVANRLQ